MKQTDLNKEYVRVENLTEFIDEVEKIDETIDC